MEIESISKQWEWSKANRPFWLTPSKEAIYLAQRWKEQGRARFLDFGCGLGRHSLFFAENGFSVKAFDLSEEAVHQLKTSASEKGLSLEAIVSDMHHVGYEDGICDCLLAYHVCSHTDAKGILLVVNEVERLLSFGGEFYLDLCNKNGWMWKDSGYPRIDESTVICKTEGPEYDVPHFCASLAEVQSLFARFTLISVEERVEYDPSFKEVGRHYWIHGAKR